MTNKVAYVTGGMGGIGTAMCQRLHQDGFTVVAGCGPTRDFQKWLDEQKALGFTFYASVGNVAEWESTVDAFAKAKADHGPISVLVNNAGITKDNLMLRMKGDDWDEVINTNLSSIFRTTKAVLKGMTKARWGRIINISSVVGTMGNGGQANYAASKAGIEGFGRSLAKEIGSRGITVNAVAPGFIQTDMTHDLPEKQREALLSQVPAARLGEASEIAETVMFLASDGAAYITGETIHVNGGMYMA